MPLDDTGGALIKSGNLPSQAAFNHKNRDITNDQIGRAIEADRLFIYFLMANNKVSTHSKFENVLSFKRVS